MGRQRESFLIETATKHGRCLRLREVQLKDVRGVLACLRDPAFRLPYLTGTPDPVNQPVRPRLRAIDYVLKALISSHFGSCLFGARRHWIMTIEDRLSGAFIGIVMLDGVVRFPPTEMTMRGRALLESFKSRGDQQVGDGEWGFFLHPQYWREGIALQSIYALSAALASLPSWCAPGHPILQRVWAQTGSTNTATRRLLEKAGLVMVPTKQILAENSPRFEPDGTPISLVHYDQPGADLACASVQPVTRLLERLERQRLVSPRWRKIDL